MIQILSNKLSSLIHYYGDQFSFDAEYFIKNGFWVIVRQGVSVVAGLTLSIVFTRLASQEIYGQYQLVLAFLSTASILSIPGLNASVLRSAARGLDGDYKNAVQISFLWSLIGIPILFMLGGYYFITDQKIFGISLMLASIFFPFIYAPNTWDSFLQGKGRFDIACLCAIMQTVFNTLATAIVVIFIPNDLRAIITMYLVSYAIINIYCYKFSLKFIENNMKDSETVQYGWFLTKMTALGNLATYVDSILVGLLLGPQSLAVYTVVSLIPLKLKDISKTLIAVAIPKIARSKKTIIENYREKNKLFKMLILFIIIITSIYYFSVTQLNLIFFGENYATDAHLSQYLFPAIFFSLLAGILGNYNIAKKNRLALIFTNPIYQISKIILSVVLISQYDLMGAIISLNLSYFLLFILNIIGIRFDEP